MFKGHCYNWGEKAPASTAPPAPEPQPLDIKKELELKGLANQGSDGLSEWTWQYLGIVNGQPREQIRRHLYNPRLTAECSHCKKSVPPYIDMRRLTAGPHCNDCNGHQLLPEAQTYSYLRYELERKPENAIISNHQGYVAKDPLLADEALWNQGGIFHLCAPMVSGKTTLIYQRAREAAESGCLTIVAVPRISLPKPSTLNCEPIQRWAGDCFTKDIRDKWGSMAQSVHWDGYPRC